MNSTKKLVSQSTKKLGSIYKNWAQLERFSDHYKWKKLVEKFPHINEDTLFVYCDRNGNDFRRGEIIKLEHDDGTISPYFTNGKNAKWTTTISLAVLPADKKQCGEKKLGEIYKGWRKLKPLPHFLSFKELKEDFSLTEETLYVVREGGEIFTRGQIVKLVKDDNTTTPLFTTGKSECYKFFSDLAILPSSQSSHKKNLEPAKKQAILKRLEDFKNSIEDLNSIKKLGDIYEDWEKLERFPKCYTWKELVKKFPHINKDTLFVCNGRYFRHGEIIKLEKDDGTINPYFTNGRKVKCLLTTQLAVLPTEKEECREKKLGDIYEDWDQLERFSECYLWKELIEKFPNINKDTLFVCCDREKFRLGEIVKLETDDGTRRPYFTNGKNACLMTTDKLAVLPTEEDNTRQFTIGSNTGDNFIVAPEEPEKPIKINKQKFEHKIEYVSELAEAEVALASLEKEGWELINLKIQEGNYSCTVALILKRSVE